MSPTNTPMRSQVVSVLIEQPFDQVYGFLLDPLNFPSWGPVESPEIHHIGGGDWLVDLPGGRAVLRFTEPNVYGVLDFRSFPEGGEPSAPVPARVMANGDSSQLELHWRQRPGISDGQFAAEVERVQHRLEILKALLESEPAP